MLLCASLLQKAHARVCDGEEDDEMSQADVQPTIPASEFEAVDTASLMVDPDSAQVRAG